MKDVVRGHVALKIQAIQELEPTLELPDLGAEGWNVQLFRSIDSSERQQGGPRQRQQQQQQHKKKIEK